MEIARQAVKLRQKVLICAPSNVAVDNIVEKLSGSKKLKLVRLGHPARLMDSVLHHSLEYRLSHSDGSKIVADIRKDIDAVYQRLRKAKGHRHERQAIRSEIKSLQKELRQREEQALANILLESNVVLCTLAGAGDRSIRGGRVSFDLVIIDEAAQALEAACWIPMRYAASKVLLAGDPFQLPPTVLSKKAQSQLQITLFERLYKKYGDAIHRMLQVQYRMNKKIMQWSSDEFYSGNLKAHESVAHHLLKEIEKFVRIKETIIVYLSI